MNAGPKEAFAKRLAELRTQKGLSVEDIADQSGIPRDEYQRWENGEDDRPSTEALRKVAAVLDADPDELIRLAGWGPIV